jgi:hypothetical protein
VVNAGEETPMFVVLAVLFGIAWLLGLTVMKVSSFAIHVLLILAVISVIVHFVRRTRSSA